MVCRFSAKNSNTGWYISLVSGRAILRLTNKTRLPDIIIVLATSQGT
ncbi:hypothetical protein I541_1053 [Mycobacteroides abscessus]|nr:hypothetical protein L836_2317 [Mycobacteroides abscessus MAB_110811_2726]EUA84263.1 hypothetical protein I541_1053 [Mycobacteroides abscessus]